MAAMQAANFIEIRGRLLETSEHALNEGQQRFTDGCEGRAASAAMKQLGLMPPFDLLDLIGDRRLADAEAAGGLAEAAVQRHGKEGAGLAGSHSFDLYSEY